MAKCKYLPVEKEGLVVDKFPSFSATGSIRGMKKLFYGENALLVRCGSYVYNVSSEPRIYEEEAYD